MINIPQTLPPTATTKTPKSLRGGGSTTVYKSSDSELKKPEVDRRSHRDRRQHADDEQDQDAIEQPLGDCRSGQDRRRGKGSTIDTSA